MPNPVRQALQGAVERFTTRVEKAYNHDAMSIATGKTPVREGDVLTEAQTREATDAAVSLLKDVPIGALSPELASSIQKKLSDAGIEVRDIASARLGDAGAIGSDVAKTVVTDLVKDFKKNSPTAFYSLAAGAAAAVGYTAWDGGSAKLARLGIKPEINQKLFDGKLEVKLGPDWKSHFKDFGATASVTGKLGLGKAGDLTATVAGNSRTGFESAQVNYNLTRQDWNLSASALATRDGMQAASARVNYHPSENFNLSAGVAHDFRTDRTTADAEVAWKARKNVDLALSASHDSAGSSRVGVGVRIGF